MGKISIFAENSWLDHILKVAVWTPPTDIYLSLHTADPTEDGSGAECANANNYSRTTISSMFSTVAASRIISNDGLITCPTASGSWGTVTDWGIWDSGTWGAGNLLAFGTFTAGKAVGAGQTPKVNIGEIDISVPTHTTYGMTTFCANEMLDMSFLDTNPAYTPAAIYAALATGNLNDAGSMTNECAFTGSYARLQHEGTTNWNTAAASVTANKLAITFVTATGSWGTVSDYFLTTTSAEDTGDMLLYGTFDASNAVTTDDQANIPIGDLDITMA